MVEVAVSAKCVVGETTRVRARYATIISEERGKRIVLGASHARNRGLSINDVLSNLINNLVLLNQFGSFSSVCQAILSVGKVKVSRKDFISVSPTCLRHMLE